MVEYSVGLVHMLNGIWIFVTPWTETCQASLSITNSQSLLKLMAIELVMTSNHLILCCPFTSHLQSFKASRSFLMSQLFASGGQSWCWSFSFNISPSNEHSGLISVKNWLVWSPCSPRDSQESSPAPQFKSINSLGLSLLYGPALTYVHNSWKNHSFDYTDLCWQSNASAS